MFGLVKFSRLGGRVAIPETTNLLDAIGVSATGAWSTRLLRSAYAGSCLRVRRSSDNTEQDIGFSANLLNTTALSSFVGANNGFVVTWYDQSGNTRDVTQGTAAQQPQIMASGVLKTVNGNPAMEFTGSATMSLDNATAISSFITASAYTVMAGFRVITYSAGNNPEIAGCIVVGSLADWSPIGAGSVSGNTINGNHFSSVDESVFLAGAATSVNYATLTRFGSGALSIYQNGGTPNTDASAANVGLLTDTLKIGGRTLSGAVACFTGLLAEALIFNTSLSNANVNILGGGSGIIKGNMSTYNGTSWTTI